MKKKFLDVGDRVAYTGWEQRPRIGLVGKVVALDVGPGKPVGVEFEVRIGGHSCDDAGKNGNCWWVTPEHLTPVGKDFKRG